MGFQRGSPFGTRIIHRERSECVYIPGVPVPLLLARASVFHTASPGKCQAFVMGLSGTCQGLGPESKPCQAFVMALSGVCQVVRLTAFRRTHMLVSSGLGGTKLVLDKITESGKRIPGFANLPVTAQISMLYDEIEAARRLRIPLSAIQSALNQAGSTVTLRYLREALSVVRARMKKNPDAAAVDSSQKREPASKTPAKPVQPGAPETPSTTPKEAREQKAERYTGSASNNALLRQLQSKE